MEKVLNNFYVLPHDFYPMNKLRNYINLGVVRNYLKGIPLYFQEKLFTE